MKQAKRVPPAIRERDSAFHSLRAAARWTALFDALHMTRRSGPLTAPGDVIRFDSGGRGVQEDTVRETFWQDTGYEAGWACVLTQHSWTWERNVVAFVFPAVQL